MAAIDTLADRLASRRAEGSGDLDGGSAEAPAAGRAPRITGLGRVLVFAYGILVLAATGRSIVQIAGSFSQAPVAYSLSALAAVVYLIATAALVAGGPRARRIAWAAIALEFGGVVAVGMLSGLNRQLFPADAVWSHFGKGYGYLPAVLPLLGMAWLESTRPGREPAAGAESEGGAR